MADTIVRSSGREGVAGFEKLGEQGAYGAVDGEDKVLKKIARVTKRLLTTGRLKTYPWSDFLPRILPPDAFFVQIGAHEGKAGDPIRSLVERNERWRGVLIEPVPYLFERLVAEYPRASTHRFENIAIGELEGTLPFYMVQASADPETKWATQLGSFSRAHILKHDPNLEPMISEIPVRTERLASMFARLGIKEVDLLVVDTEGFDWEVLSQIAETSIRPKAIIFERFHMSASDCAEAAAWLKSSGYRTFDISDFDTLAWRTVSRGGPG